ncbi:sodium:solute symporter [Streptomyces hygroscopicus subsp. limoneus]|nr:sodium:solute symporter [Streptomyces hygroscopicus subsp. limoneus]
MSFAAIGIGALVPAVIMSIAAANLFPPSGDVCEDFVKPDAAPEEETKLSELVSLLLKVGALVFVLTMDKTVAINFRLLGGIWILRTFPAPGRRPVHPLVPPLGAARRLGGRHGPRDPRRLRCRLAHAGALRRLIGVDPRHRPDRLHRPDGVRAQRRRGVAVAVVLTVAPKAAKAPEGIDATAPGDCTADAAGPEAVSASPCRRGTSPAPDPSRELDPRMPTPSP